MNMKIETPAKVKRQTQKMSEEAQGKLIGSLALASGAALLVFAFMRQFIATTGMSMPILPSVGAAFVAGFVLATLGACLLLEERHHWNFGGAAFTCFLFMVPGILIAGGVWGPSMGMANQYRIDFLEEQGYEHVSRLPVADSTFTGTLPEDKIAYYEGVKDGARYEIHILPEKDGETADYEAFKQKTDAPDQTNESETP